MSKGFITGTNEELIKAYKESRDESYLKELIEANKGLINLLVSPYLTSSLRTLLAILKGEAVVLTKKSEHKADVLVGKNVDKRFAINSMVGAVKALML